MPESARASRPSCATRPVAQARAEIAKEYVEPQARAARIGAGRGGNDERILGWSATVCAAMHATG